MKILIDEDVHIKVINWLSSKDHDVKRTPTGFKNGQVLECARNEFRLLITRDKDFSNTILYPPKKHNGIVVLRIHPPTLINLTSALERLFSQNPSEGYIGHLYLVGSDSIEVYGKT